MAKIETVTIGDVDFESIAITRRSGQDGSGSPVHQVIMNAVVLILDDNGQVVRKENHSATMKITGNNPNRSDRWTVAQIKSGFSKTFGDLLADLRESKAGIPRG